MQSILLQAVSLQDLRCIQQKHKWGFQRISRCSITEQDWGLRVEAGEEEVGQGLRDGSRNESLLRGFLMPSPHLHVFTSLVFHSSQGIKSVTSRSLNPRMSNHVIFQCLWKMTVLKLGGSGKEKRLTFHFFMFGNAPNLQSDSIKKNNDSPRPRPSLCPHKFREG